MQLAATEDLLLIALAPERSSAAPTAPEPADGRPLSEVLRTVGSGDPRLSQQVELVAAIEGLVDDGLIERSSTDRGEVLSLTRAGVERASEVRTELATTPIEVVEDDGRRELPLETAAAELDRSLVEIVSECTDEQVYHRQDQPITDGVVGREPERARWEELLEATIEQREGKAVFMTGPGGIGKTSLADALLDHARDRGLEVAPVRCHSQDGKPYQPIRAIVERLAPEQDPFARPGIDVEDADAFEAQRTALFHDVTDVLTPADAEPPRVLFFDDVHLADTATFSYLEYLLDRLPDEPVVLLGSYRPAELPESAPVSAAEVTDADPVDHLPLSELDPAGTRRMIEGILGRAGVPDPFLDAVHEYTGGHPLFVRSVVETLLDTEQLDPNFEWYPEDAEAIDVPEAVQTTVEQFLDGLDDRAREVLQWAALAGESVSVAVLDRVCDRSPGALETTLAVLSEAGLFHRGSERGRVTFTSEVVRETLVAEPDSQERRRRHAEIATALEVIATEETTTDSDRVLDRAAAIARHYDEAGRTDAAIEWYREAARRATEVYAHQVAIEHSHRALDLARATDETGPLLSIGTELAERYVTTGDYETARQYVQFVRQRVDADDTGRRQHLALVAANAACSRGDFERAIREATEGLALDGTASPDRCRLLDVRARSEIDRGAYETARETATQLRELACEIDDAGLEAAALGHLGAIAKQQNAYEESGEFLQEALEGYEAVDDQHGVATVWNNLGMLEYRQAAYDDARAYFERALEGFETVGDRHGIAQANLDLGNAAWRQADLDGARAYYRTALDGFQAVGDRHGVAKARLNLGNVARDVGEYDEAREWFRQALEGYRDVGDRHSVAHAHLNLGSVVQAEGDYETAREYHRRALEGYREVGDEHRAALSRLNLGYVARHQGDYDEAAEHLSAALEGCKAVDDDHNTALARNNLARVALSRGEYGKARELADSALEGFREVGNQDEVGKVLTTLGTVARKRGEIDRASDLFADAMDAFDTGGDRHQVGWVRIELGVLARYRDEHERAREYLREAIGAGTEHGDRHTVARAHSQLAAVARQQGDLDRAETHLEEALEGYRAIGDRHGVGIVDLRRARLACDREEYERAREHVENARERFERIGARHWLARACFVLGTIARATADAEQARSLFEGAFETFEAIGAVGEAVETLTELVEVAEASGDQNASHDWCDRGLALIDEHDPTVPAVDREWFETRRKSTETGEDPADAD